MIFNLWLYCISFLIFFFSWVIILAQNPVHSAFSLISIFFLTGYLLFFFNIKFLGLVIIILYAGAISILFLFIIFTINLNEKTKNKLDLSSKTFIGLLLSKLTLISYLNQFETLDFYWYTNYLTQLKINTFFFDVSWLGTILFTNFIYIFLVIGVLLLSGMITIIVLTKKTER